MFETLLTTWDLTPDAAPFDTQHSWFLHVRADGAPATLKIRKPDSEEVLTGAMLNYYAGQASVRVLRAEGDAVLMERACGSRSLWEMALGDADTDAAHVVADVVAALHEPREQVPPEGLTPLAVHFESLFARAGQDERLNAAADIARELLCNPDRTVVLHGDLHHNNVLFDDTRGWLAIDPKGLLGDRGYEIANAMCNPWPHGRVVHDADRALRYANIFSERLRLQRRRIFAFAMAHAALAAAWSIDEHTEPRYWLACVDLFRTLHNQAA